MTKVSFDPKKSNSRAHNLTSVVCYLHHYCIWNKLQSCGLQKPFLQPWAVALEIYSHNHVARKFTKIKYFYIKKESPQNGTFQNLANLDFFLNPCKIIWTSFDRECWPVQDFKVERARDILGFREITAFNKTASENMISSLMWLNMFVGRLPFRLRDQGCWLNNLVNPSVSSVIWRDKFGAHLKVNQVTYQLGF